MVHASVPLLGGHTETLSGIGAMRCEGVGSVGFGASCALALAASQ